MKLRAKNCGAQVAMDWERAPGLARWLQEMRERWLEGQLLSSQISQLAALGVEI